MAPSLRFFDHHEEQLLHLTLGFTAPHPTTFYKVKLEGAHFAPLPPGPDLIGTAPYHPYGPMKESLFPGWEEIARLRSDSTFCSSAVIQSSNEVPRLAVKGVLFLETDVLQQESAERMLKEAKFYAAHLQELQGKFVPRYYGLWHAPVTQWGGEVLIAVMEWGGMRLSAFLHSEIATLARRFRIAEALDELHDHGVYHAQIGVGQERHVLYNIETESVRFVDFSDAFAGHICGRQLPVRLFDSYPSRIQFGCREAYSIRQCLDLFGNRVRNRDDDQMNVALMHMQGLLARGVSRREALHLVGCTIDHWRTLPEFQLKRRPVTENSIPLSGDEMQIMKNY
ncbi:uncharacterized protein C8R40DRAFT_1174882 [Lentinula edodes]|uniref:uncharacterized protein n=1 Tax=Lentinula edodes TaxID=5353 RepID=UPI001E8CDDDC|nr:uncharacterized protein C8R40DRAFT_1174882 [Lentinula edodes]KAH7871186.1 hypothetical protein C8R40DRAFT_1174882 [Lentinula edodes]